MNPAFALRKVALYCPYAAIHPTEGIPILFLD
jgi:hypothetical protein